MRLPLSLFVLAALAVAAADPPPAAAQKGKEPPPQNELALTFADNPEAFKGKTLTFLAELTRNEGPLRERVGTPGAVPLWVYPPNNRKSKLLLGVAIPKDFPAAGVPNARGGEEVVVTFVCTVGKTDLGNKVLAIRRPE